MIEETAAHRELRARVLAWRLVLDYLASQDSGRSDAVTHAVESSTETVAEIDVAYQPLAAKEISTLVVRWMHEHPEAMIDVEQWRSGSRAIVQTVTPPPWQQVALASVTELIDAYAASSVEGETHLAPLPATDLPGRLHALAAVAAWMGQHLPDPLARRERLATIALELAKAV